MTKIILIGVILLLALIRFTLPFFRERVLDKKELDSCPINMKFGDMLNKLDESIFNGQSTVTVYDDNPEYIPDNPAVIPTEYPQTKYGPYPADPDDDPSQPPVYASVYGPPPVLNTEIPQPVYGTPVAAEEEE